MNDRREFGQFGFNKLDLSPCSVEYVATLDAFVVGCYELVEDQEDSQEINNRRGCLLLLKDVKVIHKHLCSDGGVFDICLATSGHGVVLYAAHSNGVIGIYEVNAEDVKLTARIVTEASMLTSIFLSRELLLVGDSVGCLHCYAANDERKMKWNKSVTKFSQPIWCINVVNFHDRLLIFCGSDDCCLRVFGVESDHMKLEPLAVVDDFTGGVTSLHCHQLVERMECFDLLVGSYDESVRRYNVTSDGESVTLSLIKSIEVPGGGIWKIKTFDESHLLLAGMYSGAHLMKDDKICDTFNCTRQDEDQIEKEPLIYGVAADSMSRVVVTDFNRKSLHWLSK